MGTGSSGAERRRACPHFRAAEHRLFADHVTAEYRVRTEGRGRKVDEWKLPPSKPDNHWLDCLVGCAVAASTLGVALTGMEADYNGRS
ncbi:hypothetical protein LCGC14_2578180 [marine sediment metagenome]|uniref:Terminase large subunit GpA endonuclease domain-containing protein n=1 Tax=marine sediment metagenome TaxID=412755 RepID=A0A0F9D7Y9_9ZZZZ